MQISVLSYAKAIKDIYFLAYEKKVTKRID